MSPRDDLPNAETEALNGSEATPYNDVKALADEIDAAFEKVLYSTDTDATVKAECNLADVLRTNTAGIIAYVRRAASTPPAGLGEPVAWRIGHQGKDNPMAAHHYIDADKASDVIKATCQPLYAAPPVAPPSVSALRHAKSRFECLAEMFQKEDRTVDWAMCSTDAGFMSRAIESSPPSVNSGADLEKALRLTISHIEHMSAWITAANGSQTDSRSIYSFESLGEDMSDIKGPLTK